MSAQNTAGIQTLLEAEREAQAIVQKARAYRTQRVKDARIEAQKEIEEYKKKKDAEFKRFEADHSGVFAQAEQEATNEVEQTLQQIKKLGEAKAPAVVRDLVEAVTSMKPAPHRNAAPPA